MVDTIVHSSLIGQEVARMDRVLGLGNIKNRIVTIGEGIRSQFSADNESNNDGCVDLEAGAKIISHYQVDKLNEF